MKLGISWILFIADWVASLDGAVRYVPTPSVAVLPAIALGMLWLFLWKGKARAVGLAPVAIALGLWFSIERPAILIAESGDLVGILGPEGRALSKPRGQGFVARSWLENDGDPVEQVDAHARVPAQTDLWQVSVLPAKTAKELLPETCKAGSILVTSAEISDQRHACDLYDATRLKDLGPVAIYATEKGLKTVSTRQITGNRLWTSQ